MDMVLGIFKYVISMLTRVRAHRHSGEDAVIYCPLQEWRTYSFSCWESCWQQGLNCQPPLRVTLTKQSSFILDCIQWLLNTRVSRPTPRSNSGCFWSLTPSVFSTETASKLYLSLCLFLLPSFPFHPGWGRGEDNQERGRMTLNCRKVYKEARGLAGGHGTFLQPFLLWALPQDVIVSRKP